MPPNATIILHRRQMPAAEARVLACPVSPGLQSTACVPKLRINDGGLSPTTGVQDTSWAANPEVIVTPAESDFLFCLAALSLSFAGFSAVVVTLRGALGGEISDRHLRLVRLYIEGGLLVTALALIPALLNLLHLSESVIWPVSSSAAALVFTILLLTQIRRRRVVEAGHFPPWVVIIYAISLVTVAGLWLNAAGTPFPPSVGPYAVALTWALCVFGFIFVRTIDTFLNRAGT